MKKPLAQYSVAPELNNTTQANDSGYIRSKLLHWLMGELEHSLLVRDYFQSAITGLTYDCPPASDPICYRIYEGRLSIFDDYEREIQQLKEEIEVTKKAVVYERERNTKLVQHLKKTISGWEYK